MVRKLGVTILSVAVVLSPLLAVSQQVKSRPLNEINNSRYMPAKNPNVLFEGYSKILLSGAHVGYTVLRYEFDPKKKQFQATYLVKTDEQGGNILESLKAFADQNMKPISYEYTSLIGKQQTKTIDAKFVGNRMTATVKQGKDQKKIVEDLSKDTFLGIFLYNVILRSPSGLKTETRYDYKAIAEEDAKSYSGLVEVGKEEEFNGIRSFKATNTFKSVKYSFYLTDSGEALMTDSATANIKTILVANPQEAVAKFKVPSSVLASLFGDIPEGDINSVSKALKGKAIREKAPTPTKQYGMPQDPKFMMKNNPEKSKGQPDHE